jgi:hypothetical protein
VEAHVIAPEGGVLTLAVKVVVEVVKVEVNFIYSQSGMLALALNFVEEEKVAARITYHKVGVLAPALIDNYAKAFEDKSKFLVHDGNDLSGEVFRVSATDSTPSLLLRGCCAASRDASMAARAASFQPASL